MAGVLQEVTRFADENDYGELLWKGPDRPHSMSHVFLFASGLVCADRRIQECLKWKDVTSLKHSRVIATKAPNPHASGSPATVIRRIQSFFTVKTPQCGLQGSSFELTTPWETVNEDPTPHPQSDSALLASKEGREILSVGRHVQDAVAEAQLPRALNRIEQGEMVSFRFLSANKCGLQIEGGDFCPWGETTRTRLSVVEAPPPHDPYQTQYSQAIIEHCGAVLFRARETLIPNAVTLGRLCTWQAQH